MVISNSQQSNIFSDDRRQRHFAELCNALYERELQTLANSSFNNVSLLQRKIGGLRHHIKRAADQMLSHDGPLQIDLHNASWQAKQAAKCPFSPAKLAELQPWFSKHARMGLCVPVYVNELGNMHIEIDSLDRIELEHSRLHLNKFGWFDLVQGSHEQVQDNALSPVTHLLKPSKNLMLAASCGHTWNHRGRILPRTLSLRELLLCGNIDWKNFR